MRLLIIDGHAFAYRAFYGIRGLTSPSGRPTNAIYGFINMLSKLEAKVLPTHAVVVWDGGLDAERVEELDDYKGERDPMPDDMEVQLDSMVEYLEAEGWASVCDDGIEADDRIGQLAKRAEAEGFEVVIASSDKDFFQLINDRVKMVNPADKSGVAMDAGAVVAKTGVKPSQIVDWLSLVGDAADNIPGVPGVGVKTASALLNQFGSVDGIYARLDEVKRDKQRESLAAAEADVRRNQSLVLLKMDLPGEPGLENLRRGFQNTVRLEELFEAWGFGTMLNNLREARQGALFEK
ncbi:MAG TPA: 5'-3' exonuclease H3TH domain-containing protein [Verrucomicrobiota bacterium]|nr:5'-3' exonuclease H3TH domain-containing protein [Verrucomicrobiota bacterium]